VMLHTVRQTSVLFYSLMCKMVVKLSPVVLLFTCLVLNIVVVVHKDAYNLMIVYHNLSMFCVR